MIKDLEMLFYLLSFTAFESTGCNTASCVWDSYGTSTAWSGSDHRRSMGREQSFLFFFSFFVAYFKRKFRNAVREIQLFFSIEIDGF